MAQSIRVPGRFNGPLESGNGGYSSGIVAACLGDGPAAVSLRRPVPLDTPLEVAAAEGSVRVLDGETLIAEAQSFPGFAVDLPEPVGPEQAREAMTRYRGAAEGLFSRCFVCGRGRSDSFGVFAGPVEGRRIVASLWTPSSVTAGPAGHVRPEFVWSVLDCPASFAANLDEEDSIGFLARFTVRIDAEVSIGEEYVLMAWPISIDGRKRRAGSALLTDAGRALAVGEALVVEPRQG